MFLFCNSVLNLWLELAAGLLCSASVCFALKVFALMSLRNSPMLGVFHFVLLGAIFGNFMNFQYFLFLLNPKAYS